MIQKAVLPWDQVAPKYMQEGKDMPDSTFIFSI